MSANTVKVVSTTGRSGFPELEDGVGVDDEQPTSAATATPVSNWCSRKASDAGRSLILGSD